LILLVLAGSGSGLVIILVLAISNNTQNFLIHLGFGITHRYLSIHLVMEEKVNKSKGKLKPTADSHTQSFFFYIHPTELNNT